MRYTGEDDFEGVKAAEAHSFNRKLEELEKQERTVREQLAYKKLERTLNELKAARDLITSLDRVVQR